MIQLLYIHAGVYLSLKQMLFYTNDTIIPITEIGETDEISTIKNNGLQCITDRKPCCKSRPRYLGEWYFPSGEVVSKLYLKVNAFYRNRGPNDGTVNLNCDDTNITYPTGLFCCVVPDATDVKTICANIGM